MKRGILGKVLMTAALVVGAAAAADGGSTGGRGLSDRVRHEILMYSNYTLWDDISFRVDNGNVSLLGAVSQPYKRSDLQRIVQHIPGVASVTNELKVLPVSFQDDRLRLQVARAIYRDPVLSRYAMGAIPSADSPPLGHRRQEGDDIGRLDPIIDGDDHRPTARFERHSGFRLGPLADRIEIEVLDLGQREDQADRRHEQLEGRTDEEADGDAVILGHHTQQPGTHGHPAERGHLVDRQRSRDHPAWRSELDRYVERR